MKTMKFERIQSSTESSAPTEWPLPPALQSGCPMRARVYPKISREALNNLGFPLLGQLILPSLFGATFAEDNDCRDTALLVVDALKDETLEDSARGDSSMDTSAPQDVSSDCRTPLTDIKNAAANSSSLRGSPLRTKMLNLRKVEQHVFDRSKGDPVDGGRVAADGAERFEVRVQPVLEPVARVWDWRLADNADTLEAAVGSRAVVHVGAEWHGEELHAQPAQSAQLRVTISPSFDDATSPLHYMCDELLTLTWLCNALDSGECNWLGDGYYSSTPVVEAVAQLLAETSSAGRRSTSMAPARRSTISMAPGTNAGTVFPPRTDLDFTEHLWLVLKSCPDSSTLRQCLNSVFHSVYTLGAKVRLNSSNRTRLAVGLQEAMNDQNRGSVRPPRLDGLVPVHMMFEIGLNKLFADYKAILMPKSGAELVPSAQVSELSADWRRSDAQLVAAALRLHAVCDCVALLTKCVGRLPHAKVASAARLCFAKLAHSEHPFAERVELQLKPVDVPHLVQKWQVSHWRRRAECTMEPNLRSVCLAHCSAADLTGLAQCQDESTRMEQGLMPVFAYSCSVTQAF